MARPADHADYGGRILQMDPPCSGRDVWELQIKLIGWGSGSDNDGIGGVYEPMKVNGNFDLRTRHAVMRFQKAVKLKVTGIADSGTFAALDREAALYPVLIHQTKCPCVTGANDGPIFCRCNDHPSAGKCTGFGNARFAGKFLLDGKKLGDNTDISTEKLDLYDMEEYPGIDKAVTWAVRALMRRAAVTRIGIASAYRCWEDNYHHNDDIRWRHRRLTFHFGKTIEFFQDVDGKCADKGADPTKSPCLDCAGVRKVALEKCGFQLRWQEPDRVSLAEGSKTARQPATPFAVHVDTVRRHDRQADDFVKTFFDSVQPLSSGKTGFSFPVDLGDGIDPQIAASERFFSNVEKGPGGWYPLGLSRIPHGGIHLHVPAGTDVHAIADGQLIGFRTGEAENVKPYGSRNFVLLQHLLGTKKYYSLYYHLAPDLDAAHSARWLKLVNLRAKKHFEASAPAPYFITKNIPDSAGIMKPRLKVREQAGLAPGEMAEVTTDNTGANTLDDQVPADFGVAKLADPADTWVAIKLDGKDLGKIVAPDAGLQSKVSTHAVAGLSTPIQIFGGEVIGKVAKVATDDNAKKQGTFVHVEIFSDQSMMPGDGWTEVDLADANSVVDRKAIVASLLAKNLIAPPLDKVLLEEDVTASGQTDTFQESLRAAVLKMPSAWSMDWKGALSSPDCLQFLDNPSAIGDAFNDYRWWDDLKNDKAALPASTTVFHYHPIGAILAMIQG